MTVLVELEDDALRSLLDSHDGDVTEAVTEAAVLWSELENPEEMLPDQEGDDD